MLLDDCRLRLICSNLRKSAGFGRLNGSQNLNRAKPLGNKIQIYSEFFTGQPLAQHIKLIEAAILKGHRACARCILLVDLHL